MASVVIYTSPTCHFCHMAKEFFAQHNVEYEERDVASNPEFAREVVERSGQMGVPVVFVTRDGGEEEMVVGFDEARLREVLKIQE